jgi:hypothetical protein
MSEPSVEAIVEELAADIRVRAPARFSADYPSTIDFKVGMIIADWRKKKEALEPFAEVAVSKDDAKRDDDEPLDEDDTYWSVFSHDLRARHFRAARAALSNK